jgi:hypothetical protein
MRDNIDKGGAFYSIAGITQDLKMAATTTSKYDRPEEYLACSIRLSI